MSKLLHRRLLSVGHSAAVLREPRQFMCGCWEGGVGRGTASRPLLLQIFFYYFKRFAAEAVNVDVYSW